MQITNTQNPKSHFQDGYERAWEVALQIMYELYPDKFLEFKQKFKQSTPHYFEEPKVELNE